MGILYDLNTKLKDPNQHVQKLLDIMGN